jgi:hypothetical protein
MVRLDQTHVMKDSRQRLQGGGSPAAGGGNRHTGAPGDHPQRSLVVKSLDEQSARRLVQLKQRLLDMLTKLSMNRCIVVRR